MTYQCIPLSSKDYRLTLKRVLEHPTKAKTYLHFSEKYNVMTEAIKSLESLGKNEHLSSILKNLKAAQKSCQEGMGKLLDAEYHAMQREIKQGKRNADK
jgi:hypothetical protein